MLAERSTWWLVVWRNSILLTLGIASRGPNLRCTFQDDSTRTFETSLAEVPSCTFDSSFTGEFQDRVTQIVAQPLFDGATEFWLQADITSG
jgi:hypothetical protein